MPPVNYLINKISIIENLPLFLTLSLSRKKYIASKCQVLEFQKGEIIYNEGGKPDYFYCMITGRVEIYHPQNKAGKTRQLRLESVRRGEYFGSISSLTGQPHTVSARALNDSVVLAINRKDFGNILKKIPGLAVFLSHSLSRRIRPRGLKKIFESKIIAICTVGDAADTSLYTRRLAGSLRKESKKKVLIVKSGSISRKKDVSPRLTAFTGDYHYVLVDVRESAPEVSFEILKQSDASYILSPSDESSLLEVSKLIKKLESSFGKHAQKSVSVILKEDSHYDETSYIEKSKILSKDVYASLPANSINYKKAVRRIARELAGLRLGLALGSGAAMGLAHIGVLKTLEKEKIPVDIIAATSMGALIAAFWAAGFKAAEIEKAASSFKSKLRTLFLVDPTIPIRGLIKGKAVRRILKSYLGSKTFYDIKFPLKVISCDIRKRKERIIDKGLLVDAVMASIAIPGVFHPVEHIPGVQLVDGGIVNAVPVSVLSRMGVKRIIAVNTLPSPEDIVRMEKKRLNIYDIIVNSFQAMEFTIAENSCRQADVYLHPIPRLADWYEFYKAKLFIKTGENHAKKALPEIKKLIRR